jgi:CHAT domain-containing protein
VAGPGLRHAEEEVQAIARIWPDAKMLTGSQATVDAVTTALADTDLVHFAAHGAHRGDNPLLSGIQLEDGHLIGYELARARKQLKLAVLSCCDIGMVETASGTGLAQILVNSGANAAIASVTPVSDRPTASLMAELHLALSRQETPASALAAARAAVSGPLNVTSAAGFVCFGHG